MSKKQKTRRKSNLKKPNSQTWKNKADKAWKEAPGPDGCEICLQQGSWFSDHQVQNHHLIGRTNLRYRHCLKNRIRLCSQHHTMGQYRVKEVAHGDLEQVRQFEIWLAKYKPTQYEWWCEHRDDKRPRTETYQESFERLTQ